MASNIIMPSLGFDMTEGKLIRWLFKPGEKVQKGQAIAEIETEKATVEIEATVSGTLQKIIVPADQKVPVGTVIGIIAEPGEQAPSTSNPAASVPVSKPETARPKDAPEPEVRPTGDGQRRTAEHPTDERIKASPIARRMAREAGLDLAKIRGSGPGGRIMERDIQTAQQAKARPVPAQTAAPQADTPRPEMQVVPQSRMRQAIARRMTESKTTVPHFYVAVEIDMTKALQLREQINAIVDEGAKVSINDMVVAAVARTLPQFENLNASYKDGGLEQHQDINIGVAVAVEEGLITPVVKNADKKTIRVLAAEGRALTERARTNRLRADDLGGASFTISNLGMFGVDEFSAIINPPEAAILAVGAAVRKPVVDEADTVRIAPMMKVTLSVDHRVADGAQAARFLQALRKLLESPLHLLWD